MKAASISPLATRGKRQVVTDGHCLAGAGIVSVRSTGDCRAPGAIVHAVYAGHECAPTIGGAQEAEPNAWERPRLLDG